VSKPQSLEEIIAKLTDQYITDNALNPKHAIPAPEAINTEAQKILAAQKKQYDDFVKAHNDLTIADRDPGLTNTVAWAGIGAAALVGGIAGGKGYRSTTATATSLLATQRSAIAEAESALPALFGKAENGAISDPARFMAAVEKLNAAEAGLAALAKVGKLSPVTASVAGCGIAEAGNIVLYGSDFIGAPQERRDVLESTPYLEHMGIRSGVSCVAGAAALEGVALPSQIRSKAVSGAALVEEKGGITAAKEIYARAMAQAGNNREKAMQIIANEVGTATALRTVARAVEMPATVTATPPAAASVVPNGTAAASNKTHFTNWDSSHPVAPLDTPAPPPAPSGAVVQQGGNIDVNGGSIVKH
jgi:hypothetical protein